MSEIKFIIYVCLITLIANILVTIVNMSFFKVDIWYSAFIAWILSFIISRLVFKNIDIE